jgi:phosphatidylglycerophosphate synthase
MKKIPSIKELRKEFGKKGTNGFINPACDFLAFYPAKIFLLFPFTPNQITIMWVLLKVVMALFMLSGNYIITVIALLIFQLASIIDGVDGIVARYRKHYSLNGQYLDYIGHYLANSVLLICLAIGTYKNTLDTSILIITAIGVFSFLLGKALTIQLSWYNGPARKKIDKIIYTNNLSIKNQGKGMMSIIGDFLLMDNPLNLMFWGVLLGYPTLTLTIYSIMLFLDMIRKLFLQFIKIYNAEKN